MGHMLHHVVIVIGANMGDRDWMGEAHAKATALGLDPTPMVRAPINAFRTFMVPPDGSKEGWEESDKGEGQRIKFTDWLDEQRYEDGSTPLHWAHVAIGDDDSDETGIVDSWANTGEAAGEAVR